MDDEITKGIFGFILGVLMSIFVFVFDYDSMSYSIKESFQKEAISAGVAEYYIDKDLNKQFRYITK